MPGDKWVTCCACRGWSEGECDHCHYGAVLVIPEDDDANEGEVSDVL